MYRRVLLLVVMLLFFVVVMCQPPLPGHRSKNNAGSKEGCVFEIDKDGDVVNGDLDTATVFMLSLGVIFLLYGVRRNNKSIKEDKRL